MVRNFYQGSLVIFTEELLEEKIDALYLFVFLAYLVDALIKKETETKSAASKPTDPSE